MASVIIDNFDTDVTERQISEWSDGDLYDWLIAWDYTWNGSEWVETEGDEAQFDEDGKP